MSESKRSDSDVKSPVGSPIGDPQERLAPPVGGVGTYNFVPSNLTPEDMKSVDGCIRAIVECLVTFGLHRPKDDRRVFIAVQKTRQIWYQNSAKLGPGGWMTWAKYKFAAYKAFWIRNTLPPCPIPDSRDKPHLLACGVIQTFINRIMRSGGFNASDFIDQVEADGPISDRELAALSTSLLSSVSNLKKGCPRPTKEMVDLQVVKTCEALTTRRPEIASSELYCPLHEDAVRTANENVAPHKLVPRTLDKIQMERQLRRTVREVFSGVIGPRGRRTHIKYAYSDKYRYSPTFPTTKATYTHSQRRGGGVAAMSSFLKERKDIGTDVKISIDTSLSGRASDIIDIVNTIHDYYEDEDKHDMTSLGNIIEGYIADAGRPDGPEVWADLDDRVESLGEVPDFLPELAVNLRRRGEIDKLLLASLAKPLFTANVMTVEQAYKQLYDAAVQEAVRRVTEGDGRVVLPVGLQESLKIRVITKGDATLGFALKPLQKFMWTVLAHHPVFQLVGRPVNGFVLQDQVGVLQENEEFISGDYSAATDNLDPFVSDVVADEIATFCGLTTDERFLFHTALTGHIIEFPDGSRRRQLWGQLMGSVVSFPVLCIANAAMSRWAYELSVNRLVTLRKCPMLINGDDILLRGPREITRFYWERTTAFGGLQTSLGKTYYSPFLAQINSEDFYYKVSGVMTPFKNKKGEEKMRELHFISSPYVNLGLLLGLKRSGEVDGAASATDPIKSLGSRCRDLISRCHPSPWHRQRVYELFMKYNISKLDSLRGRVPWHMPEDWGGLGLPILSPPKDAKDPFSGDLLKYIGPSDEDLRVAARIREHPELYPVGVLPAGVTWETHRFVMKKYRNKIIYGVPNKLQEWRWAQLYRFSVVEQFFLRGDELFTPVRLIRQGLDEKTVDKTISHSQARSNLQVLRRNEQSWKSALRDASIKFNGLPPALSLQTVLTQSPPVPFLDVDVVSDTMSLDPLLIDINHSADRITFPMDPWFTHVNVDLW